MKVPDRADLPPARGGGTDAAAPPVGWRSGALVKTRLRWREESRKTARFGQNRRSLEANRPVWFGNAPFWPAGRFGPPAKPQIRRPRPGEWSKPAFSVPTVKAGFDHGGRLPVSGAPDRLDLPDARGFGSVSPCCSWPVRGRTAGARRRRVRPRPRPTSSSGGGGAAPIFSRSRSRIAIWDRIGALRRLLEGASRTEGARPNVAYGRFPSSRPRRRGRSGVRGRVIVPRPRFLNRNRVFSCAPAATGSHAAGERQQVERSCNPRPAARNLHQSPQARSGRDLCAPRRCSAPPTRGALAICGGFVRRTRWWANHGQQGRWAYLPIDP